MHVAIDISALSSGHRVRGVGSYTQQLLQALEKHEPGNTYTTVENLHGHQANADVLHYTYLDLFSRPMTVSSTSKTVITVHDVVPLVFPNHFPVGIRGTVNLFLVKRMLRRVSAIITDSEHSKKDISQYLDVPLDKIMTVYLAAGAEYRKLSEKEMKKLDLVKKYQLPVRYILYVGDVNWNKNIPGLVEAFRSLSDDNISLVLVGKALADTTTPETMHLIHLVQKWGLEKKVRRIGFVPKEDLVGIYNGALGYVQPSFYEGFGFPVLEAMQCGTPVVTSNVSSLPEIAGDAGIMVDPEKPDSIAQGIHKLCNLSVSGRKHMIENGMKQAKKFTWEQVAHQTVQVYRSVLGYL